MGDGGCFGVAESLEIFLESVAAAGEELTFVVSDVVSKICVLCISVKSNRQEIRVLTGPDKSASQTEQRISKVLHRLRKTPAVEHVDASKDAHRGPEQPRVPNEGAPHDHSGDFLACVIDHQRSSFEGCHGVACRKTKRHESDE